MVTSSEKDRKAVRQKKKERDAANSKTVKKQSKSSVAKSDDLPAAVVKEIDAAIKKSQRQSAINKGELPAGKKKVKSTVVKSDKLPADTKIKNDFKMHTKGFDDNTEIIIKLHTEVKLALASAFENAIAIGDLLFRQKAVIPYGEFGAWIEKLPMEVRTAQRYMKLFMYQKPLAKEGITTITNAYHRIFGEPISDEVAEVDDSPDIKTEGTVVELDDIEDLTIPKRKSKGPRTKVTLDNATVDKFIAGNYFIGDQKGRCAKIIVEIHPSSKFHRVDEFLHAAEQHLQPGGYIMFRKP